MVPGEGGRSPKTFQYNLRNIKLTGQHFSPTVPPFTAGISHVVDVEAPGDESGNI
jgi:hypothetical protein